MAGAQTGRFSSTDPNLQNIPIKLKMEKKLEKSLSLKKDANYFVLTTQIELRLLSHIANIDSLKNAF